MSVQAEVEQKLRTALAPSRIVVVDESAAHAGHGASGAHLKVTVVSTQFEGKSQVARHRMVYACLGDAMKSAVHALAITARTPAEDDAAPPQG